MSRNIYNIYSRTPTLYLDLKLEPGARHTQVLSQLMLLNDLKFKPLLKLHLKRCCLIKSMIDNCANAQVLQVFSVQQTFIYFTDDTYFTDYRCRYQQIVHQIRCETKISLRSLLTNNNNPLKSFNQLPSCRLFLNVR